MLRRVFFLIVAGAFSLFPLTLVAEANPKKSPNIIIFVSDDQHLADMEGVMPQTIDRIFKKGVTFENAFVTTPWCCPSRASIFTGKYAYKHGVKGNRNPLREKTITHRLKAAGYYTGIIGKYLNSWKGTHRKEFDFWRVFAHGNASYTEPRFNENGVWKGYDMHIVDLYKRYMKEFFQATVETEQPFLLFFTPNIPHRPAIPEKKYEKLFEGEKLYRAKNQECAFQEGKPDWVQNVECFVPGKKKKKRPLERKGFQLRQRQALRSLDDVIGEALDMIRAAGEYENTAVFFISDNGMLRGSFGGLQGKPFPYEDAIHVPFGFRYPPLTEKLTDRKAHPIVANIDIPATAYDLAGVTAPPSIDGRSLLPLVQDSQIPWRDHLLYEGFATKASDKLKRPSFAGIRTLDFALIISQRDRPELYDMKRDSLQTKNIIFTESEQAKRLFRLLSSYRPETASTEWIANPSYRAALGLP
ncbi:sulfatase-like hydrolase/transferase [bacterium]|nr:sulfatase-like hydrolase/transferase [bacterium]